MKKFVVLLAVLSVASLAQASYYLTVNGADVESVVLTVGQTATIGIWSTDTTVVPEPTAWGEYGQYHQLTLLGITPGWTSLGAMSGGVVDANAGASASTDIWSTNGANGRWSVLNPTDLTAGKWFEFTYTQTVAGPGEFLLTTWGPGWASTIGNWDTVAVNPIPEPATMMILGLGALGLLRKRA